MKRILVASFTFILWFSWTLQLQADKMHSPMPAAPPVYRNPGVHAAPDQEQDLKTRNSSPEERMKLIKKRWERIRMLRIYKLIEFLDLNEEDSASFLPLLQQFEKKKENFRERQRKLSQQLKKTVGSENATERELRKLYKEYLDLETRSQKSRDEFRKKASTMLTLKQQIKLDIFDQYFRENIKEIIRNREFLHQPRGMEFRRNPGTPESQEK